MEPVGPRDLNFRPFCCSCDCGREAEMKVISHCMTLLCLRDVDIKIHGDWMGLVYSPLPILWFVHACNTSRD